MSDSDGPTDDREPAGADETPSGEDPASSTAGVDETSSGEDPASSTAGVDADGAQAQVTRADLDALRDRLDRFEDELEEDTVGRDELDAFEDDLEDRTVHRDEVESDLRRYVRRRARRGKARGWGPYLVLLYGTVMTLGAFVYLGGGWAVLAMVIVWLSTLGLYALMVIVGLTSAALGAPGKLLDRLRDLR